MFRTGINLEHSMRKKIQMTVFRQDVTWIDVRGARKFMDPDIEDTCLITVESISRTFRTTRTRRSRTSTRTSTYNFPTES